MPNTQSNEITQYKINLDNYPEEYRKRLIAGLTQLEAHQCVTDNAVKLILKNPKEAGTLSDGMVALYQAGIRSRENENFIAEHAIMCRKAIRFMYYLAKAGKLTDTAFKRLLSFENHSQAKIYYLELINPKDTAAINFVINKRFVSKKEAQNIMQQADAEKAAQNRGVYLQQPLQEDKASRLQNGYSPKWFSESVSADEEKYHEDCGVMNQQP